MSNDAALSWMALLGLGALHGLNPAMGWLFAVGRGLQEQSSRAVWRSLGPLAVGHALAIGVAVGIALALGLVMPPRLVRWTVGGLLIILGFLQLARHRHPRWGGMRMGRRELTVWSFLMASAHGAGLMVLPLFLERSPQPVAHSTQMGHASGVHHGAGAMPTVAGTGAEEVAGLLATLIHSAGYLVVTGFLAVLVYERLGLRLLRSAWVNLDLFWALALIAVGGISLMM